MNTDRLAGDYQPGTKLLRGTGVELDSVALGRGLFFSAVWLLREDSNEALRQLSSRFEQQPPLLWEDPEGFRSAIAPVRKSLQQWCSRIGVEDVWFLDCAIHAVCHYRWNAEDSSDRIIASLGNSVEQARESKKSIPSLTIDFGSWNVLTLSRQKFGQQARMRLQTELTRYCNRRIADERRQGMVLASKRKGLEPYFWVAGFQCRGWSINKIADAENKDRRTVGQQIRKLASEICLTLRFGEDYDKSETLDNIRVALRNACRAFDLGQSPGHLGARLIEVLPPVIVRKFANSPPGD